MNNIIKVIKLYAVASSNENKPNPIPLFQTKYKLKKELISVSYTHLTLPTRS